MGICMNCTKTQRGSDIHISSLTKPLIDNLTRHIQTRQKKPLLDERFDFPNFKEAPNAIISKKAKSDSDVFLISSVLKTHYIFNSIDHTSQLRIIKKVKCYELGAKEIIFEQGQPGICFFVISSGRVEVILSNEKRILGPGKSFGELALIDDRPRKATVRTVDPCVLWGLDRITFTKALKRIRMKDYEENKKFISSIGIFNILSAVQKEALLGALVTQRWKTGQIVIKEGDNSDMLYILKEGIAICNPEHTDSIEIHKGDYFGEHALMYQTPQRYTVIAATDLVLISIGRNNLIEVLGTTLEHILYRNSQRLALEKSQFLRSLLPSQRESIIDKSKIMKYKSGEKAVEKGQKKSEKLIIVINGKLVGDKSVEPLQCLGDEDVSVKGEDVFPEDYLSIGESDVAEILLEDLERSIGGEVSKITIYNDVYGVLRQVQLLRGLPREKIESLAEALRILNFEDQEVIVRQSNPGKSFFIIKSGSVRVFRNDRFIRNITKNDYFGERSVLFNDFRTATIIADGPVSCWTLERSDFNSIISDDIRDKLVTRIELQDASVFLEDLVPIKLIAKGELGIVTLAVHKQKRTLYVLKSMMRQVIEENRIHSNLVLERNVLMQIDHLMIIKMIKTFKDEKRIYYLLEYVKGKDLFDVRTELGTITEEQAKFYAASLAVTLEYLHDRNIIHRDVKPENVIIDEEGYTKLIDFGAANIVEGRTYTAIGTPHYLAPEIILRTGYSFSVDWWSLGVLLHELVYGYVPFGADEDDPVVIYERILENRLSFFDFPYKSQDLKPILTQLLNKNPAARTCGGFGSIKKMDWFSGFSWDRLMSRQLRPPYSAKRTFQEDEVERALSQRKSIDEFLEEFEGGYLARPNKVRSLSTINLNWDENF